MLGVAERRPEGMLSKLAYRALGGDAIAPEPTAAPPGAPRVLVGPANYAGQGYRWARALESSVPGLGARSLAVTIPGTIEFPSDSSVPITVYRHSRRWQDAEFAAVTDGFDHVLLESMRPLFGSLFGGDLRREVTALQERGISIALIAHGTDVRSPRDHVRRHRWSPFTNDPRAAKLQEVADRNRRLADGLGMPLFVSTPGLLDDLAEAAWCPVVIEAEAWRSTSTPFSLLRRPIVVHAPSSPMVKGTTLIEPVLHEMHEGGLIEYRRLENVRPEQMPAAIAQADVVLDQFRIGDYGVAACEAMAAGRIVVGHVSDDVRSRVEAATGWQLPIVEADVTSLASVLTAILDDPDTAVRAAGQGQRFVAAIHDGRRSAAVLVDGWVGRGGQE